MKTYILGFLISIGIWSFWSMMQSRPRNTYSQRTVFGLKPARRRPRCELCPRCGALKPHKSRPCYRCGYGFVDFAQYIAHAADN